MYHLSNNWILAHLVHQTQLLLTQTAQQRCTSSPRARSSPIAAAPVVGGQFRRGKEVLVTRQNKVLGATPPPSVARNAAIPSFHVTHVWRNDV